MSYRVTVHAFSFLADFELDYSGKSHDSLRISSKSSYIRCDPRRKILLYPYNNPMEILYKFNSFAFAVKTQAKLTNPSGCSLIRNFFLLNESFLILAHEKVFMRVMPWNTAIPIWATDKFSGTPSWSLAGCIFMPYSSQRRAVSSRFRSASAGDWPLFWKKHGCKVVVSGRNDQLYSAFSIIREIFLEFEDLAVSFCWTFMDNGHLRSV